MNNDWEETITSVGEEANGGKIKFNIVISRLLSHL
jgi:hypothetical protein